MTIGGLVVVLKAGVVGILSRRIVENGLGMLENMDELENVHWVSHAISHAISNVIIWYGNVVHLYN